MSINHPCSSVWPNRRGETPLKSSIFLLPLARTIFYTNTRLIFKRFSYNSCQIGQSIRSKVHVLHFSPIRYDLDHSSRSLSHHVLGDQPLASLESVSVCPGEFNLSLAGCRLRAIAWPCLIFTSQSIWQFWVHRAFTLVPRGRELNSVWTTITSLSRMNYCILDYDCKQCVSGVCKGSSKAFSRDNKEQRYEYLNTKLTQCIQTHPLHSLTAYQLIGLQRHPLDPVPLSCITSSLFLSFRDGLDVRKEV